MTYYEIKDFDLAGRIGRLKTKAGIIETPYLFPVVDPVRQEVELNVIRNIGFNGIITNAYLFYKRSRGKIIDIHEYLEWKGPIMTDSGGYQVLEYGDIEVSNKTIVGFQKNINVDIGVILDVPTGSYMNYMEAYNAVNETYKRSLEALPIIQDSETLWVYPIQGAPYKDLVVRSSIRAWKLPYHIYAFGSPTVLLEKYSYGELIELLITVKMIITPSKPLHVFGVGHPMIIPYLIALGADLFDSASYILYARDNRYMTEGGTKKLEELEYFPCACPICTRYSPKELLELDKKERVKLIAIHNLYMLRKEINEAKQAIKEGRLWELLEKKSKLHPSLRTAFNIIKTKAVKLFKLYTPLSKGSSQALMLYDYDSIFNPKITIFKERISYVCSRERRDKIALLPAIEKPYKTQGFVEEYRKKNIDIVFYNPFLGIVPMYLSETYPVFQHEEPTVVDDIRLIDKLVKQAVDYVVRNNYRFIEIVVIPKYEWTQLFSTRLISELSKLRYLVNYFKIVTYT